MALKVIGAGFGRTGTASLRGALEELGFSKCYHMQEVLRNPGHPPVWQAAAEGRPINWDALLEGYQATVDWPGCTFYKELIEHYPDAKVLLNVRDPEAWYKSMTDTIYRVMHLQARMQAASRLNAGDTRLRILAACDDACFSAACVANDCKT